MINIYVNFTIQYVNILVLSLFTMLFMHEIGTFLAIAEVPFCEDNRNILEYNA